MCGGKQRLFDVVGHAYRGAGRCRGYLEVVGLVIVIYLIHDGALAPNVSREPLLDILLKVVGVGMIDGEMSFTEGASEEKGVDSVV